MLIIKSIVWNKTIIRNQQWCFGEDDEDLNNVLRLLEEEMFACFGIVETAEKAIYESCKLDHQKISLLQFDKKIVFSLLKWNSILVLLYLEGPVLLLNRKRSG